MFLSLKRIYTILFILIFSVPFCFGEIKSENSGAVRGTLVTDSGSFTLADGFEFTKIWVIVQVYDGDINLGEMTAHAYIHLNNGDNVSRSVCSATETPPKGDGTTTSGATSCTYWYYSADARFNTGVVFANCYWQC